jgi:hypothetical protein
MPRRMSSRIVLGALVVAGMLAGCAPNVSIGPGGGPPIRTCTPGRARACFGAAECLGFQSCAADGASWGDCDCVPPGASACPGTQTDPANCGYCGHDCQGGACQAGVCQPVVFASGQKDARALVVDEENLYWTTPASDQAVMRLPLGGGAPITLASDAGQPFGIAVDQTSVYWVDTTGPVMTVGKDGGLVVQLAAGPFNGTWIAVDATSVYWTVSDIGGPVMKVGLNGGPTTVLASNQSEPYGFAVDATRAYWATSANTVVSVPLSGGAASVLFTAPPDSLVADALAVDATSLYFVTSLQKDASGSLVKMPLGGGAPAPIMSFVHGGAPNKLALDGGTLFWTDYASYPLGTVKMMSVSGGTPVTLASGQDHPYWVAVSPTAVFWSSMGDGTIMKVAR